MAVHLPDLKRAEAFYSGVLGFRLLAKTGAQLEYDTGRFVLYVNKSDRPLPPMPSFTVIDARAAKDFLEQNGCEILQDRGGSLQIKYPFGFDFDVLEY
ncbi:MAG TPA: VOC family protein [Opitutus sp.]|nr:VOC family protein [Opitutus sp.]